MELMLPVQIVGLALAGRALLEKYAGASPKDVRTPIDMLATNFTNNLYNFRKRLLSPSSPLNPLVRAIEPSIVQLRKFVFGDDQDSDDYEEIVKRFLPDNAIPLMPERPSYIKGLHLTDLDGDGERELIASYRLKDDIKTIILKKEKNRWYKASEISNPGYRELNYRDVVNISGLGKRHLVLGLSSRGKPSTVCGYTFDNGEVYKAFSYNCNKFDVLRKSADRNAPLPMDIAIWNKQNDGTYDISFLRWNGIQFEPMAGEYSNYYEKKAVPYFAMKAKYAPYSAANWYNLAVALVKAGAYRDALTAVNVGIDMDRDGTFKDRFLALRSELR